LISRLRQKVEPNTSDPRFITTVRGRGYRLLTDPES
jgi:DNA-binding response OmpR family regulator